MSTLLKDDLINLKSKLENIESQLESQIKDLEVREDQWKKLDEEVEFLIKNQNNIIKLNIGGKHFATKTETLLSVKDTLFYQLVLCKKFNIEQEIFFDRSPKYFPYILDYMRHHKINFKRFNNQQLDELLIEAEYYEIGYIVDALSNKKRDIEFVSFETNGAYSYNGQTAGTNKVEDLSDMSCMKGICATSPGWIIIELNNEWEFSEIEIAGWAGNSSLWSCSNGSGANILTSLNKSSWNMVGTIPSNFGSSIQNVSLTKSIGKYIKFESTSYLGLGYLKIKKI